MKRYKKVYIEITNVCNMNCNFCPKTVRKPEFMSKEGFITVIDAIKPYTDYVYFHLMGEPFLHPELSSFLEICQMNGLKVNITTNGTLLNEVKDLLIASPALRKVSISLHSFEANEQNVNLQEYMDSIVKFIYEVSKQSKIICELRLWNLDSAAIKASNRLNDEMIAMLEAELGQGINLKDKLKERQSIELGPNIYLGMAEKFAWPDIKRDSANEKVFCYGLRDQLGILVDGTVVPCCLDSEGNIPLGNIFKTPLEEILNSTRAKELYEGFSRRTAVEELCKRCGYARRKSQ